MSAAKIPLSILELRSLALPTIWLYIFSASNGGLAVEKPALVPLLVSAAKVNWDTSKTPPLYHSHLNSFCLQYQKKLGKKIFYQSFY